MKSPSALMSPRRAFAGLAIPTLFGNKSKPVDSDRLAAGSIAMEYIASARPIAANKCLPRRDRAHTSPFPATTWRLRAPSMDPFGPSVNSIRPETGDLSFPARRPFCTANRILATSTRPRAVDPAFSPTKNTLLAGEPVVAAKSPDDQCLPRKTSSFDTRKTAGSNWTTNWKPVSIVCPVLIITATSSL